jgi:hypothetical protein
MLELKATKKEKNKINLLSILQLYDKIKEMVYKKT